MTATINTTTTSTTTRRTTITRVSQVWDMIETWGFCENIKDTMYINVNDNNKFHYDKDDDNNKNNNNIKDDNKDKVIKRTITCQKGLNNSYFKHFQIAY